MGTPRRWPAALGVAACALVAAGCRAHARLAATALQALPAGATDRAGPSLLGP